MTRRMIIIFLILLCFSLSAQLNDIRLPSGFKIGYYASEVPGARSMVFGDRGTLFVGTREDRVYALVDTNKDNKADKVHILLSGLNTPNGLAFKDGSLYVAEINRVLRYDKIESRLENPPKPVILRDDFPRDRHHGWKYIAIGPDDHLYVPVGAPCNVCDRENPIYSTITRLSLDGKDREIYASGVRNTVGFAWHPDTGELWFTDNGRDRMGDDIPPDELNHAPEKGLHFGFPYIHGQDIKDPVFGKNSRLDDYKAPEIALGPHVAALGMKFYTGNQFPSEYDKQIFIAEHGSWNRTVPIGYRIALVRIKDNVAQSYEVFADGWLKNGDSWGRPVDILVHSDGSLLVSDDEAGAVYNIWYEKDGPAIPKLGDVNQDDEVNIIDALLIAQKYVGLDISLDLSHGDVNKDKLLDIVDALLIAQFYVGLISGFRMG